MNRLDWHIAEATARDERFSAWASRKASQARQSPDPDAIVAAFLDIRDANPNMSPEDVHKRALIKATGWADCECGRVYQPGDRNYTQCFHCNQMSYADGSVTCVFCRRRHGTKYPCCVSCASRSKSTPDDAAHIRSVVLRRDAFTCQLCHEDEGSSLQVDHIDPNGSAWWWNLQVLCTSCQLVKGKQFGPQDELAKLDLMFTYAGRLGQFLYTDERVILQQQLTEILDGTVFPVTRSNFPRHGRCDELEGLINIVQALKPTASTHHETVPSSSQDHDGTETHPRASNSWKLPQVLTPKPGPCSGEIFLSTGRRPCRNIVETRIGSLCEGPCQ